MTTGSIIILPFLHDILMRNSILLLSVIMLAAARPAAAHTCKDNRKTRTGIRRTPHGGQADKSPFRTVPEGA